MPSACPPTPRMERDGCPSWGFAALRGHRAPSLGRSLVSSDPFGVLRPSGSQLEAAPPRRSEVVGPPCAFAPLQRSSESHPRTVPPTAEAMRKPTRCLSWTLLPYDTCQRSGVHDGDASDVTANHVRGLATPFAAFTTRSRDRDSFQSHAPTDTTRVPERPWAFSFKGFPSSTIGTSLEAHAFLPVPPVKAPSVDGGQDAQPPSRRCSRVESVRIGQAPGRIPKPPPSAVPFLEFIALQSIYPRATSSRFDRGASLHALRQGDVPVYRGPKVSRTHGGTDPSRDL
jgi:hypothetical protein